MDCCARFSQCYYALLRFSFSVSLSILAVVFLSVCMDVYQCLSGFVWTLAIVFLFSVSVVFLRFCMNCCAFVSQCLYGLLRLCFSVFVWTLALVFFSVCMHSCACVS